MDLQVLKYNNHMPLILLLSILGFLNAYYLHYQYKQYISSGKKMYCLIGGRCEEVVSSKYGTTLRVKNEIIGMAYYVLLAIDLSIKMLIPAFGNEIILVATIATILATIFSLYLLFVQTIILKTLCSWCLIAITINILIFYFLTFSSI